MTASEFRVLVRGRFDAPDQETRAELVAAADDHDLLRAAFTEDGTLTYERSLNGFTFRCTVTASGERAEEDARVEGELKAAEVLDNAGWPYRGLGSSATNMDDIKIRRG
ncbi:DUF6204 family protein [Amycolatopsis marina]|nr:DUF6204 family protein [Amycolatopsis marina]